MAVGECGLDYNRNISTPQAQRMAFEQQLSVAVETGKPLFLHCRDAFTDFHDNYLGTWPVVGISREITMFPSRSSTSVEATAPGSAMSPYKTKTVLPHFNPRLRASCGPQLVAGALSTMSDCAVLAVRPREHPTGPAQELRARRDALLAEKLRKRSIVIQNLSD